MTLLQKSSGIYMDESFSGMVNSLDGIIFDCDGVLIDITQSYDRTITKNCSVHFKKLCRYF